MCVVLAVPIKEEKKQTLANEEYYGEDDGDGDDDGDDGDDDDDDIDQPDTAQLKQGTAINNGIITRSTRNRFHPQQKPSLYCSCRVTKGSDRMQLHIDKESGFRL